MTKLPAIPDVEAEALAIAVQWFRYWREWRDAGDPLTEHSPLTADAGRAWARHILRIGAAGPVSSRLQLVAYARQGDPDAQAVVLQCILELQSRGEPLPTEFAAYNMDLAAGLLRSQQKSGPKKKDRMTRDWFVALAVALLLDRFGPAGLMPTRNSRQRGRPSPRRSACALAAEGYGSMTEKAVEKIWTRLRGGMPTVPGWSSMVVNPSGEFFLLAN
jgi:hypothetical protein